ncbi:hypothetical protein Lal_00036662 [Lupinus albus]|nr:hypothetical protein Lal_00036662 [Lupinus albus]
MTFNHKRGQVKRFTSSPVFSLTLRMHNSPNRSSSLGFKISDSRSSEDRLAWARTHDSSQHSGTDALARATFSRLGESHSMATPPSRLSELYLAQAIIPGKYLGTTLSPSLGRAPLAQARITKFIFYFLRYNPGWRNHPYLKWSDHIQQQQPPHAPFQNKNVGHNRPYVPPPIQQQRQKQLINNPPPVPIEPSLEKLVRQMTMQNIQFQQETRASIQRQESSIQNLTTQMGQMATSLNTLQSQNSDKLPSQTVINPKNVSAITLRSGK